MAIQRESLVNIASKRIKQDIIKNGWQPGDKYLSEKELIQRLEVSRTVIRETLVSLQSVGIIKIISGDGVYIADPNIDPIKEILRHHGDLHGVKVRELVEIRKVIELGALRLMIEKDITVDIQNLIALNEDYYQAIIQEIDTRPTDRLFHQFLIKSTMNHTFYHFSEIIQEYFTLTKIDLLKNKEKLLRSYKEHQEIIYALEKKDMLKAQGLMIEHLQPILKFTKQLEDVASNGTHSSN